jgi:NAD(P)-dependent dehydrogenase (short-subunit alcohol dehydrogenase family)
MAMAIARRLGRGYRLLIADRDAEHLVRQAALLQVEGHDVRTATCDVTDADAVKALATVAAEAGGFRALVHVVGLAPSMADWRTVMTVNLIGPALIAESFLPLLGPGAAGVFIASLAAHLIPPPADRALLMDNPLASGMLDRLAEMLGEEATSVTAYYDSKAALVRLCQRLAAPWGRRGARVMSLSPGLIASPMGAREFAVRPAKYDLLIRTPIMREGTMLEIADAVEFLLSDRASFISGIDLLVDGGVAAATRFPG